MIKKISEYPQVLFNYFFKNPHAPFLSQVVITRRCNLSCGYCNEYDDHSEPIGTERLYKTIDKIAALQTRAVTFTGGEPFLHPDLIDIVRYASKKIPKVSVITNGFLLTEKMIDRLNKCGLSRMQISIDGVEVNKITSKVLNNTKTKLIMLAKHALFKVHINTVLGSIPFNETLKVVHFTKKLGLETTVQWLHDAKGHILNPENICKNEIDSILSACNLPLYHSKEIMRVGFNKEKPWKCRAGSRFLYIDEFSIAHWCSQTISSWSCEIDKVTNSILKKNFYLKKNCNLGCTLGCVRDASKYDFFRKQT